MHIPVLQKEVLEYLNPKPDKNFIDATIDGGGHATTILQRNGPKGKLLGIEIDTQLCQGLKSRMAGFSNRLILVNDSYVNLKEIVEKYNFRPVSGILFDLGMSIWHLEKSGRGFTFLKDEPLDMRYGTDELTAEFIINHWTQREIERILREYGEERFAGRIARKIVEQRKIRPIKTTFQLVEIIKKTIPQRTKIHPATRAFQALRIAVNDELNNLKKALPQALDILKEGGRIVAISFHSLEDRIVKNFFKENKNKNFLKILTKKPITASGSAKLRAAQKI